MNLYLRLLMTLLRAWRAPRLVPGDTLERQLRVLPNDLDINGHMNNGRYLTIIDLMLVEYFVRTGFASTMLRQGWRPMSGGSLISYRRGLSPLQAYTLRFRLDATDQHWNYMRFEFVRGDRVCAAGYMKGAAVGRGGLVPNQDSYAAMGLVPPAHPLPAPVRDWIAAEQGVMSAAW
ncbi:Acyl-CoA thioesterase FadM [Variovorax sp. OK605]|jgi:acyl-CoA thioesterase FadM|uniref:thioesterase family protein n=1 Tax=unclassified Variovorax TaxID=663243 RepID=UPI0008B481B6|nr:MULTISPECIES: thioesterase family protein [unclassified Variovorax]SEJ26602.1 Acyl-CoA thioesterase FadM [Variovorax sp. OK202]SFC19500.1 Acyl-CoA thioesterase FadM [Variovorax sp. OK212]SFO76525.1 Acyl-CoA thioesterase FadM [Variovorax sp. OK605]